MNKREIREWVGLAPADLPVYLSAGCLVGMFILKDPIADAVLGFLALALSIVACFLGMKADPGMSSVTNKVKFISYPLCVAIALAAIVVHYVAYR